MAILSPDMSAPDLGRTPTALSIASPDTISSAGSIDSGYETTSCRSSVRWKIKKPSRNPKRKTVTLTIPQDVVRFLSPEIERLGLQALFYSHYWSEVSADNTCAISILEVRLFSRTLALCLDTLVLLINGYASDNSDFLREARRLYPCALQSLRADLNAVADAAEPFYFMTIVHVLQCCEMFECISEEYNDWRKHMTGLKCLMSVVPSKEHRRSAEQAGWILSRAIRVPFGLWNGLMNFDPDASEQSLSTDAIEDLRLESDMLHIYGRIPEVLQHGESVRRQGRKAKPDVVANVLEELVAASTILHKAFRQMYQDESISIYRTAPIHRFRGSLIISRIDKSVFPHAHSFADTFTALQHVYYWMCLLALQVMHLDIRAAVGKNAFPFEYDFCGLGVETQTRIADECADNLSMSVAYMTLPTQGFIGLMCCAAPIEMATKWYSREGKISKLEWCRAAAEALKTRGFTQVQTG